MLLGLLAAASLAILLQLNALRARRPAAYAFAGDGVIHVRCWTVVETPIEPGVLRLAAPRMLALPGPARRPEPLKFVGEMMMVRPRTPVRRPVRPRPVVHASGDRYPPCRRGCVIPPDVLIRILPAEPSWPPHSRPPPGYAGAASKRPVLLH